MDTHEATDPAEPAAVAAILEALRQRLGPERVLTSSEAIARYPGLAWLRPGQNLSTRYSLGEPAGIVRPANAEEIAQVLEKASTARVPVVPYGAGTGVMGGALPIRGGIVLDLGAMNRILSIEKENRLARAEAGVILGDLALAAAQQGLLFAHDPWSQPIATVGGAVGTNGVGYLAAGYGSMGDQVRGLEAVLADGTIVSWPGAAKASAGPDLRHLFVGAEGTLGVLAQVIVQLFPWPERRAFLAFRFPEFGDGFRAIASLGAIGLRPAMIDYEEHEGVPLRTAADLYLIFDGPTEVVQAATRRTKRICQDNGGISRGSAAAQRFWNARHASAEWFKQRIANAPKTPTRRPRQPSTTEMRYIDVAVPTDRVLDYCQQVVEIAARHQISVRSFGIWARPELVSYILEGSSQPAPGQAVGPLDQAMDAALCLARQEGGSIEYCHGIGVRLAHLLPIELGTGIDLLRRIKRSVDPHDILNPGKLGLTAPGTPLPTPRP